MSDRVGHILLAFFILVMVGTLIWSAVDSTDDRLDDEQCIRRGYVQSLDLWGMKFCVKIQNGELVGEMEGGK